ncbi:hypothetical protein [Pseudarthrobacter naphthalenicus]|uniref:hypothetical protein n=1 Tax=Pseudarthrobacter naphthalenicus TaxID=3031328 RepID=UPI003AF00C1F
MVAAAVFLRWMPHHGLVVSALVAAPLATALAINFSRKRRFHHAINGINQEAITPDVVSTAAIAASVLFLACLGIYIVLFLPMEH